MIVRFLVYHAGFNAHPGDVRDVPHAWAVAALARGIVEPTAEGQPSAQQAVDAPPEKRHEG